MTDSHANNEWTQPDTESLAEITKAVADDLAQSKTKEQIVEGLVAYDSWPAEVANGFVEQVEQDMARTIADADRSIGVDGKAHTAASAESRHDKATIRVDYPYGGTLTLSENKLVWRRSRWPSIWPKGGLSDYGREKPPDLLEIPVDKAAFVLGPRRGISLTSIIFSLGMAFVYDALSGGTRRTIEVTFGRGHYFFSVRNESEWLEDIARAKSILHTQRSPKSPTG